MTTTLSKESAFNKSLQVIATNTSTARMLKSTSTGVSDSSSLLVPPITQEGVMHHAIVTVKKISFTQQKSLIKQLFLIQTLISTDIGITIIFLTHRNCCQAYPQTHTKEVGGGTARRAYIPALISREVTVRVHSSITLQKVMRGIKISGKSILR